MTTWGKDRPVYFLVANHTAYPEHDVVVSNYTRNPAHGERADDGGLRRLGVARTKTHRRARRIAAVPAAQRTTTSKLHTPTTERVTKQTTVPTPLEREDRTFPRRLHRRVPPAVRGPPAARFARAPPALSVQIRIQNRTHKHAHKNVCTAFSFLPYVRTVVITSTYYAIIEFEVLSLLRAPPHPTPPPSQPRSPPRDSFHPPPPPRPSFHPRHAPSLFCGSVFNPGSAFASKSL